MAKRQTAPDEADGPWKEALETFLPHFLAFFFADIHADIDWSRGYESLDKEFQKIARRAKVGKRIADKLFKVWLKDGSEHWLLIHIEIQGEYEKEFPRRMFDYNMAARQLYNREVVSLAALCDDSLAWKPTSFGYGRWGCRMELTFRVAKLIEHAQNVEELETSDNPMAALVLAQVKAIETRRNPDSRRTWKLRVVKGLLQRKWSVEDVRRLFLVIDWIMALPEELEDAFRADLEECAEENKVEWLSSIERVGFKKGIEAGLLEAIEGTLKNRFGTSARRLLPKVRALGDLAKLREFKNFLDTAASLDEVRDYFR